MLMMEIYLLEACKLERMKTTETLVFATKVIGVEVNANKTKYMVMSCLEVRMQEEVTT
jgi:fructosamine-3-kinase